MDEHSDGEQIDADICIIGAGAAGITIAKEFANTDRKICLLESGGLRIDQDTQHLYHGDVLDDYSAPLEASRLRFFGGTTNHWGGYCRPLDEIDFEERDYIEDSGWPITARDLRAYYERAQVYCQLGPFAYDADAWGQSDQPPLSLESDRILADNLFQQGPPTRFGEVYREGLRAADNIHVWLHANAVDFDLDEEGRTLTGVRVVSLSGKSVRVKAPVFVLATGGIENARILLNANDKKGLGNAHGNVGRYFMDHALISVSGDIHVNEPDRWRFYHKTTTSDAIYEGFFHVSPETQRDERLINCAIGVWPEDIDESEGIAELRRIWGSLRDGSLPSDLTGAFGTVFSDLDTMAERVYHRVAGRPPLTVETRFWSESPPLRESRVTLSDETDSLGLQRARLDWRLPSDFARHYTRAHTLLGEELGRAGLGRLRLRFGQDGDDPLEGVTTAYHHMGTTRMHADPKLGVVDADCRVHGLSNLYIAGSSVFPTSGHANPTLTIVALALRLADRLKSHPPDGDVT